MFEQLSTFGRRPSITFLSKNQPTFEAQVGINFNRKYNGDGLTWFNVFLPCIPTGSNFYPYLDDWTNVHENKLCWSYK